LSDGSRKKSDSPANTNTNKSAKINELYRINNNIKNSVNLLSENPNPFSTMSNQLK